MKIRGGIDCCEVYDGFSTVSYDDTRGPRGWLRDGSGSP